MRHINLLPWREEERRIRNNLFYAWAGVTFVAAILIIILGNIVIQYWIAQEQSNIEYLQKETGVSVTQSKEAKNLEENRKLLIARIKVIQALEADRNSLVRLWDTLPKIIPTGIYLTELTDANNQIVLSGNAESNGTISVLIKNLEDLKWVENVRLQEVSADKVGTGLSFKLQFAQNPRWTGA